MLYLTLVLILGYEKRVNTVLGLFGSSEVIVDFPNLKGWRCRADALEPCLAVGYKCDTK